MRLSFSAASVLFSTLSIVALGGCSTDTPAKKAAPLDNGVYKSFCDLPKPCREIAQACHPKDIGAPGTIHDCHITGHEVGTLDACSKVYANCIEVCTAAPALSDGPVEDLSAGCHDAGTSDGGQ
jgi:hypothetical protein